MKKKAEIKEKVEVKEEVVNEQKKKRETSEEIQILNAQIKRLRKVAYPFVKRIANSEKKNDYLNRLTEVFKTAVGKIMQIDNEISIEARIASMSDEEREYLKELLNK